MPQRYVGKDVGGFRRLADMNIRMRREDRLDRESDTRQKLQGIQLQQAEMNLEAVRHEKQVSSDVAFISQNIPEGSNQFIETYKYHAINGNSKHSTKLMNEMGERISQISKIDPAAGAELYNKTFGSVPPYPKAEAQGDMKNTLKLTVDGKVGWFERRGDELIQIKTPVGTEKVAPYDSKTSYDLLTNGSKMKYFEKGSNIPDGWSKAGGKGITINTGDVSKTNKNRLEKDIIEGTQGVISYQETAKRFKPEYLTYFGKGEKLLAVQADKLGFSSEEQKKLLTERASWFRQAKADFQKYKKWATGVAAGNKELADIAKSFPDPERNSPTEYRANLADLEKTTRRVLALNKDFLNVGIKLDVPSISNKPTPKEATTQKISTDANLNEAIEAGKTLVIGEDGEIYYE